VQSIVYIKYALKTDLRHIFLSSEVSFYLLYILNSLNYVISIVILFAST